MSILTDNFNDNTRDTTKWALGTVIFENASVGVAEANGQIEITPLANEASPAIYGYKSATTYDFTGLEAQVRIAADFGTPSEAWLIVALDNDNYLRIWAVGGGNLFTRSRVGANNTNEDHGVFTFATHTYWRIRHDKVTDEIVFEYSSDGLSWTQLRRIARPFAITASTIYLSGGSGASSPTPPVVKFDDLIVQGSNAPALFRGRSFPLFDDDEVNRFEFWPAIGAGVSEIQLTLSDDTNTLTDGEVRVLGVVYDLSDSLASFTDAQAQLLTYLLALADSTAANWADAHQLLLAQFLALSDNAASLDDTSILRLEQRVVFADTVTLSDVVELQLHVALSLAGTVANLTDDTQLLLAHRLTLADSDQQFPSTPLLDTFNRADEDPVTGWTKLFASDNDLKVLNNQLTGPINSRAVFDALTPADDQEVYVSVSAGSTSGGGSGNRLYLLLRITGQTSDDATGYYVSVLAAVVRLYRIDSFSSLEELASFSLGVSLTVGDRLGARVVGDLFEVWANIQGAGWQQIITATDSTYPTGKIGLGVGTLGDELLLDNFGGGSVTSGLRDAFNSTLAGGDNLTLGLADTLTLADSLALGYGLLPTDTLDSLTDALAMRGDGLLEFADTLTLLDHESHTLDLQLAFDDTITLNDSPALGHGLEFSETLTLTDDYSQIADSLLNFSDSLTLTDSLQLGYGLNIADDTNLLLDAVETSAPQGPLRQVGVTDAIELNDSVALELGYLLDVADSVVLADSATLNEGLLSSFTDSFTLTDSATSALDHLASLTDTLLLTDAIQLQVSYELAPSDVIALTDSTNLNLNHLLTLADNASLLADSAAKSVGIALIITDNASTLTDAINLFSAWLLQFTDTLTLNDALAKSGVDFLPFDDTLTLTDNFDIDLRGPDLDASLTDSLAFTDAISLSLNDELQLQLVIVDTITLTDHYFDLRHPYTPSTKRHIVVPSRARLTTPTARRGVVVPASDRTTRVE